MFVRARYRATLPAIGVLAMIFSASCGGGSGSTSSVSPPAAPISGEWSIAYYNGVSGMYGTANGYLTASGNNITGNVLVSGNGCVSGHAGVVGTISGSTMTLTGFGLTITGQLSPDGSGFSGSFTGCEYGSAGGNKVPPVTGHWSGTLSILNIGATQFDASATLTQASTPKPDGSESLSGSMTFTGSGCFTSGTLDPASYVLGGTGRVIVNLSDGSVLTWSPVNLTFDRSSLSGMYSISGGACDGQWGDVALYP